MAKFNATQKNPTQTTTHEGGVAYGKELHDQWSNMLFSCMLSDGFYEKSQDVQERYINLTERIIEQDGADFVAKAAHFSRNVMGLRSISELTAALLNRYQFENKRQFYAKYLRRPDGIGEIFGAVAMLGDKRSHALIRGCKDYLETLSEYQVGKYSMQNHEYNMHDIINLTHAYSPVLDMFQKGKLASPDTWESMLGTTAKEDQPDEWKRLVEEKRLGYLALIRNLRNITKFDFATDEWCKEFLYEQIANQEAIKKSLVFPYQIYTAWKNCRDYVPIIVELALSDAFKHATDNMPELKGDSAIIMDVSGSMHDPLNKHSSMSILETCAVYAAAIYVKNPDTRIIKFASDAKIVDDLGSVKNIFSVIKRLQDNEGLGYSTSMHKTFQYLDKHFDRLFVFSDMQVMDGRYDFWGGRSTSVQEKYTKYLKQFGPTTMYSFDLGNYDTQVVSQDRNIVYVTALTDMVFKAIELNEKEGVSLIAMVRDYQY